MDTNKKELIEMYDGIIKSYRRQLKDTQKSYDNYRKMLKTVPASDFGDKYDEIVRLVDGYEDIIKEIEVKLAAMETKHNEFKSAFEKENN